MATYIRQRYLFMATDPVHVGTGGYRLGRVDNSIVREPGTHVPKIPGTSLHGAARAYAAQLYETPEAAGQSQTRITDPQMNPVCYTFGYIQKDASGKETVAYSGVVNVFDAQVLFFPVHSMAGPVWVSTVDTLRNAGFRVTGEPEGWGSDAIAVTWNREDPLNLGWMMLPVAGKVTVTEPAEWRDDDRWKAIQNRLVLVPEALFSQVINSNLEVRTSVAINPERGAAEDKALFTYEALPRTTFLVAEVVLDDYRDSAKAGTFPKDKTDHNNPLPGGSWQGPLDVVAAGLRLIEWLGVGGMGTRGFGRLAIVGRPVEHVYGKEDSK